MPIHDVSLRYEVVPIHDVSVPYEVVGMKLL